MSEAPSRVNFRIPKGIIVTFLEKLLTDLRSHLEYLTQKSSINSLDLLNKYSVLTKLIYIIRLHVPSTKYGTIQIAKK